MREVSYERQGLGQEGRDCASFVHYAQHLLGGPGTRQTLRLPAGRTSLLFQCLLSTCYVFAHAGSTGRRGERRGPGPCPREFSVSLGGRKANEHKQSHWGCDGKFSLRGGFLPSQASRKGFPEEVTPQWTPRVWSQKDEGVWEEGNVFRTEEMAFTKLGGYKVGCTGSACGP